MPRPISPFDIAMERERIQNRKALREAELEEDKELYDEPPVDLDSEEDRLLKESKLEHLKERLYRVLFVESLSNIADNSTKNISTMGKSIHRSILNQYVIENGGIYNILYKFRDPINLVLSKITEAVEDEVKEVIDNASTNDNMEDINNSIENVNEKIEDNIDIDHITDTIRDRVLDGEKDFVENISNEKDEIKKALTNTTEELKDISNKENDGEYSEEDAEKIKEEAVVLFRRKISNIKNKSSKSIFGKLVKAYSESILSNIDINNSEFILESGRLNMESIIDMARCSYTILEMMSSLNMETVDRAFIEETIQSVKSNN